jgi:zinc protease
MEVPANAVGSGMTLRRQTLSVLCLLALLLAGRGAALAQTAAAQAPSGRETTADSVARYSLDDLMPVDPEAALGTLPNGLRYYVRHNPQPPRRAELRLVVKAGSVLEDDDQKGLAHFVEHMEFEGSRHFPGQSISDFLSSLGLSIGPDANAETSYDDTQYTLRLPTDVPGVLEKAMLILEDWAQGATFDESGIERERGIVLSEWRMQLGAGARVQEQVRKAQLQGSRYADRTPIGDPAIIEHATREQLVRFYRDWYRPDLMAIIVVGDIDRDAVVAMIKERFSGLANPSPARPRPQFDVPEHKGTRYAIVTDKETTGTIVELSSLRPARNQGSVGGYRAIMLDQLFADMLGTRLDELSQGPNPPFFKAAAGRALFPTPRTKDEAALQALVPNDGVTRGLEALVTELQRVMRFGFTETELARAKQTRMAGYERVVTESPDRESSSRADEYTRNFLQSEALPTIWQELAFHRRFLPGITLAEVNALARDWFPEDNRLVILSAPEADGVPLPTEAQLAEAMKAAESRELQPYVDTVSSDALLESPPPAGSIVKTTERPEAGITEWTLSNGATVVLKPTKLKEDQILFRATGSGGTSLADDADFVSARVADSVVSAGGAGPFSAVTLDKMLAGKALAVRPFIDETVEGMEGGATPQDLETMFQLLYLRFTQPRPDPTAFAATQAQVKGLLANRRASPEAVFEETLASIMGGNHPRRQPETSATVDQWSLDKAMAFYRARFGDASHFTFVFVGSFTPESMRPLVERYIASLPATHAAETWRDRGIQLPKGVVTRTITQGIAPKAQVAIVFSGPFQYDESHLMALRTIGLLLQGQLLDTIRQELGGTYSITASPDARRAPRPEYSIRISWTCDPARTEALVSRVFEEIARVRSIRLGPGQMALVRQNLLRQYESDSRDNAYLLSLIARAYQDEGGAQVADVLNVPERIRQLTGDQLYEAAQAYLDPANYVRVTLLPASAQP